MLSDHFSRRIVQKRGSRSAQTQETLRLRNLQADAFNSKAEEAEGHSYEVLVFKLIDALKWSNMTLINTDYAGDKFTDGVTGRPLRMDAGRRWATGYRD